MSAEIQTSLFILTAEIAGVATVAALVAAGLSWARGKARMTAAEALRVAAAKLPGEGEIVNKERALLGEFARAYLTSDAEVLAGLPAQLLALRQMYENIQVSHEAADTLKGQELQAENVALQARAQALEQQQAITAQQLETALATINALVQEYGRGRGQAVTPTAEALLAALMQLGTDGGVRAMDEVVDDRAERESNLTDESASSAGMEIRGRGGNGPTQANGDKGESEPAPEVPDLAGGGAAPVSIEEPRVLVLEEEASADAEAAAEQAAPQAQDTGETGLDASVASPLEAQEPEVLDLSVPVQAADSTGGEVRDELDELDIEALLDAELEKQAKLLQTRPEGGEDLDLARTD